MLLLLMLIISFFGLTLIRISFFEFIKPVAEKTHLFCISRLPEKSAYLPELKALVCAQDFSTLDYSQIYITSGLIHLFVVSGAHLVLIETLLCKIPAPLKLPRIIQLIVLFTYGLACNLNAPITRSLLSIFLTELLRRKKSHWPWHIKIFTVGLLALIFNYQWITSLSLQMSWIAAFLVRLNSSQFSYRSLLFRQSLFFAALFPTLVFFQIPSATTILLNLFLGPALELILFPAGLLTFFFSFAYPLFDYLILCFRWILLQTEVDFHLQIESLPPQLVIWNWIIILSLHFIFHLQQLNLKRSSKND